MSLILLIDDEPEMNSLVELCLEAPGARVVQVPDLAGAVASARKEPPDVVLLDLALGSEDGLAILPRLREEPGLAEVPIVAFTVHDSRRREALEKGVDGFVAKPFKAVGLRQIVKPYLE